MAAFGIFGLALGAAYFSAYNVDAGQRAIIFDRLKGGITQNVKSEGTHFRIPLIQKPIIMDVRITPRHIKLETASKDLQTVSITLRVLWRPEVSKLPNLFKELGPNYDETLLRSFGNEILTSVVAQYDAPELISQREIVSRKIREGLVRRSQDYGLVLEDVAITHMMFGAEYMTAIEQKQVSRQEAERARYLVEKAKQEKLAAITRAQGEAEAARLLQKAGSEFVELRKIEAAREIAETLSSAKNVNYIPGANSNFILNLKGATKSE